MTHDITHCTGEDCKHKQSCQRYIAHLDLKKQKPSPWGRSYMKASECTENQYFMYWKTNPKEKDG